MFYSISSIKVQRRNWEIETYHCSHLSWIEISFISFQTTLLLFFISGFKDDVFLPKNHGAKNSISFFLLTECITMIYNTYKMYVLMTAIHVFQHISKKRNWVDAIIKFQCKKENKFNAWKIVLLIFSFCFSFFCETAKKTKYYVYFY